MEQTSSGTSRSVKNNNSKTQVTFRPSTAPKQVNVLKVDRDVSLSVFRGTNKVFLTDLTGVKSLLSAPPPTTRTCPADVVWRKTLPDNLIFVYTVTLHYS